MNHNFSEHEQWEAVTPILEAFLEAWETHGEPPPIDTFLPSDSPTLRPLAVSELVKLDMEQRLQQGVEGWRLEDYSRQFEELRQEDGPAVELICEEFQLRCSAGHRVTLQEYYDRFPTRALELKRILSGDAGGTTLQPVSGPQPPRFEAGRTVEGFQLIRLLGEGAFARVFLAYQVSMQRFVALKVSNDLSSEPQMLAQLDHPYVVRVYDQCAAPGQPLRLLYMEYLAGGTLAAVVNKVKREPAAQRTGEILVQCLEESLSQSGVSDVPETVRRQLSKKPWANVVCELGAKLAEALDYAHRRNVLHRDIKPANVLLTADGTPKLADFNIGFQDAKGQTGPGVSAEDLLGGTLDYMSPEQLEACDPDHSRTASELDQRTDIYSLAVVLWELLHATLPFNGRGKSPDQPPLDVVQAFRTYAEQRRGELPESPPLPAIGATYALQRVLRRCLSSDPEQRYKTGGALARDLRLCLEPRTLHLLEPPESGWRRMVAAWPLLSILAVALVPHATAGVFNLVYNQQAIVTHLTDSQDTFWRVQTVINCVAFPLGLILLGWLTWPVVRQLKTADADRNPEHLAPDHLAKVRQRSLQLGHITACIGTSEWLVAGLAYPISLQVLVGGLTVADYLHFAASLALCGLIVAAYPFLFVTVLVTRTLYPALFRQSDPASDDRVRLGRLHGQLNGYLLMAGGVPALAMLALLITGVFTAAQHTFALIVLSILGALGFAVAFALYRLLQEDLAALAKAGGRPSNSPY